MSVESKLDQALEKAGNKNKYQIVLIIFMSLVWVQNSFLVLGPAFYYMDPIFNCTSEETLVDEEIACGKLS